MMYLVTVESNRVGSPVEEAVCQQSQHLCILSQWNLIQVHSPVEETVLSAITTLMYLVTVESKSGR